MLPGDKQPNERHKGAHHALHTLLKAVAQTVDAAEVYLLSLDADVPGEIITCATASRPGPGVVYTPLDGDVSVPVLSGERELGQLVVVAPWSPVDRRQLEGFGVAAGFILEQSGALSEAADLHEETRLLRDLGSQLGGSDELRGFLEQLVKGARRLLKADYVSIASLTPEGTTRWTVMDGFRTETYKRTVFQHGNGTAARAMSARKPIVLEGIGQSPDLPAEEFPVHVAEGGVSALAVPLMRGGVPVGALVAGSRTARGWSDSEQELATSLANSAALAMEQARIVAVERARALELEAVINQMAEGVAIFDAAGRVTRINPAGVELLGRKVVQGAAPDIQSAVYGLYTPGGEPFPTEDLPPMRALRNETVVGEQMVVRRPDGEERYIRVSASSLSDFEGNVNGAIAVFHDITQDKIAERLKDEFLSVVSHELRTPLSAIMGYSDLLLRGVHGAFTERQAKALTAVRANAHRLLNLINDLLDVSRLEAGSVPFNPTPVPISEVIARTLTQTRVLSANAGVTVQNNVSDLDLPPVFADEPRLQQIIENLLTNAVKFTPEGGTVRFTATVSALEPTDPALMEGEAREAQPEDTLRSVVISVSDTGTGLLPEQIERIWDRFYQVDTSAKRRSGGAGLGLAIVRSLVELHGGLVSASSEGEHKGSRFSFSLPVAVGLPPVSPPFRSAPPARRSLFTSHDGERSNGKTVLVAEDDDDQREIICDMLELEGYNVVLASDGEEALQVAFEVRPSAIALDVVLPRSDGWEVLNKLKSDPATSNIPVMIISVVDQQEFGKKLGADEYLIKPLEPLSLRAAVRRLIGLGTGPLDKQP